MVKHTNRLQSGNSTAFIPQLATLLLPLISSLRAIPAAADDSLHTALATADLEDHAAMAGSLHKLGLSSLLEVQLLHAEEAAEMWASLRGSAVSLGDRAKLRRATRSRSEPDEIQR
jgi:hypothetical protein